MDALFEVKDLQRENLHIRPEVVFKKEAPENFQVERITVEENPGKGYFREFLKFPDLNGKPIWISRTCDMGHKGEIDEKMKEYGFSVSTERTLTPEESGRFEKIKKLKVPELFEGYLLFNTEINLDEFVVPDEISEKTKLISVHGPTGAGKSLLTGVLDNQIDAPPFTFDRFTKVGPKQYVEEIQNLGLNKDDIYTIWEEVRKIRGDNDVLSTTMSLSKNLDEMLEFFKNGKRPKYIFIEAVTDSLGLFSTDCVFIAARDACEARIIIRPYTDEDRMEKPESCKIGISYHAGGSLDGMKVYPPILNLTFKVDKRSESYRIQPDLAEEFVAVVNDNIRELVEDY